jgi:hypothetical protein
LFEETVGIGKTVVDSMCMAHGVKDNSCRYSEYMILTHQFRGGRRVNFYHGHIRSVDLLDTPEGWRLELMALFAVSTTEGQDTHRGCVGTFICGIC